MNWDELHNCDVQVEHYIIDGAYPCALSALVHGYERIMISFCRKYLGQAGEGGRAEEIAQDIFLGAYRTMPRFRREASIRTWLFDIARKRCWREFRDIQRRTQLWRKNRPTILESAHPGETHQFEEQLMTEDQLELLRYSLSKLKRWQRRLLELRFLQGYSYAMLARELPWSESTIREQRMPEALEQLRKVYRRLEKPRG